MIYDTGEYHIKLRIPTKNFLFYHFWLEQANDIYNFVEQVKKDICHPETLIILFGGFQNLNNHDHWFPVLNKLVDEIPNPIVVFDGNSAKIGSVIPKFYYHPILMFERVSAIFFKEQTRNYNTQVRIHRDKKLIQYGDIYGLRKDVGFHTTRPKKFYWASSKDWYPRRYLLSGLIQNNLLEDSYVNYKCVLRFMAPNFLHDHFEETYWSEIKNECQKIEYLVPLPALDDTIEFNLTDQKFYSETYCSIITDTFYNFGIFLSEKIFNAMLNGHIFLFLGPPHSLAWLRNRGYYTFDSIIDTSYDSIDEPGARLVAARKSIVDFLNQPKEKIQKLYTSVLPELKHNKNLVLKQRPDLEIRDILQNILNEHRKTNSDIS